MITHQYQTIKSSLLFYHIINWRPLQDSNLRPLRPKRSALFAELRGQERVAGVEPAYLAWKASALPLCYTRKVRQCRYTRDACYDTRIGRGARMHAFGH